LPKLSENYYHKMQLEYVQASGAEAAPLEGEVVSDSQDVLLLNQYARGCQSCQNIYSLGSIYGEK
jgi:hypothetical protein